MGEEQSGGRESLFGLTFNRSIKVEARPERLSGDAGVLLEREIDERLGLTRDLAAKLHDPRNPALVTHIMDELLRARLYLMNGGWRDGTSVMSVRSRSESTTRFTARSRVPTIEMLAVSVVSQPGRTQVNVSHRGAVVRPGSGGASTGSGTPLEHAAVARRRQMIGSRIDHLTVNMPFWRTRSTAYLKSPLRERLVGISAITIPLTLTVTLTDELE